MAIDNAPFSSLTPDIIFDAIEALGFEINGQLLALNSYENRVYQIGLEDSPPIIAKFYRPGRWSNDAILEEHQFAYHLAEFDIPVVLPKEINQTTLSIFGDHRVAIYERKPGSSPDVTLTHQLNQLGRLLGRIHAAAAHFSFLHRRKLSTKWLGIEAREFLLTHQFIPDYLISSYKNLTENLLQYVDQQFEYCSHVSFRPIHGDFHLGNVLCRDEQIFIVDLDDCCSGPAVQDIWMLLAGDLHEQQAQLTAIMEGYKTFFDFDISELGLIESLRTLRIMHYASWLAMRWSDPAFPQNFPWFNTTRYWEEHIQSLQEQLYALQNAESQLFI